MYAPFFRGSKPAILFRGAILIAVIAVLDWRTVDEIPLRILYLLPMLIVGNVLEPVSLAAVAALCTWLSESFDGFAWNPRAGISRDLLYFAAYFGAGLFVWEVNRNRRTVQRQIEEIERQSEARREAEEQLKILIESSPAAIFTADAQGNVLMANEAAHRMLSIASGELPGRALHRYLPSLRNVSGPEVPQQFFRTVMQARGQREDGESFLADISFSTYRTNAGTRLAAMVLDASEELRTHEVSGLHQLLAGSRIAIGAVSHEIRNISGAVAAVHQNLAREGVLAGNRDFEALGNLIAALERIANHNVHPANNPATDVDLLALLDELRIVIAPMLDEEDIASQWEAEASLPMVWADRPSLMQVFLNLVTNSIRALSTREGRLLSITAKTDGDCVFVEFSDNGGGVANPEQLFRPFQDGAQSSGLGLYLSRAFLRSFGGEIRYLALPDGACFIINLQVAA
ncbi:MAG TPA: ATP-binding protein [Acidobacteriaceae bacterium]|nr:ATP-binding protein [Acidobacteriaceae bacterium]